jgi:predicted CoA-binding protein
MLTDSQIGEFLKKTKTIAVAGLSDDPSRDSYRVASYLQSQGYEIIPVNPNVREVLGRRAVASLRDVTKPVDLVDVFRRSGAVPEIVDDAIAIGAKGVWLQSGITHPGAETRASEAGLFAVSDRCLMVEHRRLLAHMQL